MRVEAQLNAVQSEEALSYLRANGEQITFGNTVPESYFLVTRDRQVQGELVGITDANSIEFKPRALNVSRNMVNYLRQEVVSVGD